MQKIQSKPNFGVIAIICKLPRGRSLPPHTQHSPSLKILFTAVVDQRDILTWLLHIFEIIFAIYIFMR